MEAWIQSIAWALLCSLAQGLLVYGSLKLLFRLAPQLPANARYHLALSALGILLLWFAGTWWQSFRELYAAGHAGSGRVTIIYLEQFLQAPGAAKYKQLPGILHAAYPWLAACYLLGLALMLLRMLTGIIALFALRSSGRLPASAALDELLLSLQRTMASKRRVQLSLSSRVQAPVVIGFLKPLILLPAAAIAQLSMAQVETILLHELAHIRRHDYLVNILQSVAEALLFFNPFVWMISGIARCEREYCCDDLVLQYNGEPLLYAHTLAALAAQNKHSPLLAMAATGNKHQLLNRIKRIMETKKNPFSYSRMAAAILIVAGISCSAAWCSPSFTGPGDGNKTEATTNAAAEPAKVANNASEEQILVQHLLQDGIVDEIKGFTVDKQQDKLIINGQQQSAELAGKYLKGLQKAEMHVQVFSFEQRLRMHPEAGLMQNMIPVSFSSPCVDYGKQPGC
ncbi:MAG: hypothetical protein BGO69_09410 [Bacteroidetes bacterium 46-16]|nr:MAG: hypothetical protein BGO69_09410 [Bacteroidetes bacterium 46-16]